MTGAEPVTRRSSSKKEFARIGSESECPKAYIECGMQTASQRQRYDGSGYCAPQRKRGKSGRFVESIQRMQRAHREFGEGGINQKRKFYLGGGDSANIDGPLSQGLECFGRHAGMAAHANADHGNLGDVGGAVEPG